MTESQVVDLRLLPLACAIWIGCAVGLHIATPVVAAGLLAGALLVACRFRQARLLCAGLVLGAVVAALRLLAADPSQVADLVRNAGMVDVTAVVGIEPQLLDQRGYGGLSTERSWQARATLIRVVAGGQDMRTSIPVTLRWRTAARGVEVGTTVRGRAILHPDDVRRRSAYRIAFRGPLAIAMPASRGSRTTNRIRHGLADVARAHDPTARAGATLLPGLVVGDTSAQSRALADDLRTSGLSHLTAVSGANVAIVLGAVLWLLQRTRIRRLHRYLLLTGVLLLFVAVVQPQPSVMRAAVMGGIALYALATGATKQSSAALWLSAIMLLVIDPFMSWQYGFGLSVAATAGLIVLQPMLAERLPTNRLLNVVLVTVAAQIATLPLLLVMGAAPTWLSVPANVLAEPLVAPATVSGFVATVFASVALLPIPVLAPTLHWLAGIVAVPGVLMCDAIAWIARVGSNSALAVSPFASPGSTVVSVLLLITLWRMRHRRRMVASLLAVSLVLSTCGSPHRWPPNDWWYVMCDVGQGDATVVRTGVHSAIVIDAGPDARAVRRCLRSLRISTVDALVLTHFHADHVEGVAGVVAQAEVRSVMASPLHDPLIEYQRVTGMVRQPIRPLVRGDRFEVGAVHVDIVWPEPTQMSGDPNNGSVVLMIRTPQGSVLVTGDADADAQAHMPVVRTDVLKVPHHGSRYQDSDYLAALRPGLALVSVGAGNDYGHPAPSTVSLLRAHGTPVLRTDVVGGIAVVTRGHTVSVAVERTWHGRLPT